MSKDVEYPEEITLENGPEIKRSLQQMVDSDAWKYYISIIGKQQIVRFDQIILNPIKSIDETLEQEYCKGEIAGMRTAVTLPQTLIDALENELEGLKARQEQEKGDQK